MKRTDFVSRGFDTLAVAVQSGARRFVAGLDRRRAAIVDRDEVRVLFDQKQGGTAPCELFGAVWLLSQGGWLLLPFESFQSTRAFAIMEKAGPEEFWGAALCALAIWRLDALILHRTRARLVTTLMAVGIWGAFAPMLMLSNYASPGGIAYAVFALLEVLTYRNLCDDPKDC